MTGGRYKITNQEELSAVKGGEISFIPVDMRLEAVIGCQFWPVSGDNWNGCMGSWPNERGAYETGGDSCWGEWVGDCLILDETDFNGRTLWVTPAGVEQPEINIIEWIVSHTLVTVWLRTPHGSTHIDQNLISSDPEKYCDLYAWLSDRFMYLSDFLGYVEDGHIWIWNQKSGKPTIFKNEPVYELKVIAEEPTDD